MDQEGMWYLVVGGLFVVLGLLYTWMKDLPITSSIVYLGAGYGMGAGLHLMSVHPLEDARVLETLAEVAVLISVFTAGLSLRLPVADRRWGVPWKLATGSMLLGIAMVTAAGVFLLGLPLGAALLLGALVAPTDPVLSSEVQIRDPGDTDELRMALTGEAGLNDGAAFPFVLLGLGLLGLHDLGAWGWRWWLVDLAWAAPFGLLLGAGLGTAMGRVIGRLRRQHGQAVGAEEYFALGLLALAYGLAEAFHVYGFLAVFAAGVALRREERLAEGQEGPPALASRLLEINEMLERMAEAVLVVVLGLILASFPMAWEWLWFLPLLFLVIRPLSVLPVLAGSGMPGNRRLLLAWFGIRGIGSIYYLAYALSHGVSPELGEPLAGLVLLVVAGSVIVHGLTGTPLMDRYQRRWSEAASTS